MKTAQLSPAQARVIAAYIVRTQSDGQFAQGSKQSAASTRITFQYADGVGEIYSSYTNQHVADELPENYRSKFD